VNVEVGHDAIAVVGVITIMILCVFRWTLVWITMTSFVMWMIAATAAHASMYIQFIYMVDVLNIFFIQLFRYGYANILFFIVSANLLENVHIFHW